MRESEWLNGTDPARMLRFRHGIVSDRQLWLFVVACFSRVWPGVEESVQCAVEVTERFVEGLATRDEMEACGSEIDTFGLVDSWSTALLAVEYCQDTASPDAKSEAFIQAHILRDILGNPFRPVTVEESWLTTTVVALARQMYESQDFSTMPILADALEDADCDNTDILFHCRQPGEHVRGCWVVDLLTGRK